MAVDDIRELRALQAKAYGREGGLTDAEARRLDELLARRAATASADSEPAASESGGSETAHSEPVGVAPETPPALVTASAPETRPAAETPGSPEGRLREPGAPATPALRDVLRAHLKTVIVAALALVLIGVAAGWAVFGGLGGGPRLTAGQQERLVELQTDGDYDAGSVHLIAEDDGALVWYATRRDGELACVVLDVGEASQDQCARAEAEGGEPLSVSLSVPVADPDDPAEKYGTSISATVGITPSGDPLAWIYRWEIDDAMLGQFDGAERERAEALVSDGYLPGLSIIGYFHDEPVWLAERPTDGTQSGGFVQCMVVDAASEASACRASDDRGGELRALSLETADDGTTVLWTLRTRFTGWGSPYLTIEQGDPADVGVSYVELGGEHGDPILVEVPSSESGG